MIIIDLVQQMVIRNIVYLQEDVLSICAAGTLFPTFEFGLAQSGSDPFDYCSTVRNLYFNSLA